mgnify:FL=1|jgi:toxin ParE1/3/4
MTIIWSPGSQHDLRHIHNFVAQENPAAAVRLVQRIVTAVEMQLAVFPLSGRPGRVEGTRELVVARAPYIVAYRIVEDDLEIAAIIHAARRWPDRVS